MKNLSKYHNKYMDNETFCDSQKPFIHLHLDNIIRKLISNYDLELSCDYFLNFSESAVSIELDISKELDLTVLKQFIASMSEEVLSLSEDRYPIIFSQPEANRAHNFYVTLSDNIKNAEIGTTPSGDYQITFSCDY